MKLTEAKQQFISSWGAFGTHWGINRTMAQIHALLLISPDPLTQDDIMEELNISRERVRQVECQAKGRLRKLFAKNRMVKAPPKKPFPVRPVGKARTDVEH